MMGAKLPDSWPFPVIDGVRQTQPQPKPVVKRKAKPRKYKAPPCDDRALI